MLPRSPAWLLLAVCLVLAACTPQKEGDGAEKQEGSEILPVRCVRPETRDLDDVLDVTAGLVATREGEVSARIPGVRVLRLLTEVGDRVAEGDPLAELEDQDLRQILAETVLAEKESAIRHTEAGWAVKELEAELAGQQQTVARKRQAFERARQQAEKGAIAQEDLEGARYDLDRELAIEIRLGLQIEKSRVAQDLAQKAVEKTALATVKARRDLEYAVVRAPFDGVISKRTASPGQITSTAQPLFRMFDPKSLVVETHLPQRDLNRIGEGQKVRLRSDANPGRVLDATVLLVAPGVEQESGTVMVRLRIENLGEGSGLRPDLLKPGLFVSGRIVVATRPGARTVPRKAIGFLRGQPFVFRVVLEADRPEHGKVERLFFREGLGEKGIVEVVTPPDAPALGPDDLVVLVGQDRLKDGDLVRVQEATPADREAADGGARD